MAIRMEQAFNGLAEDLWRIVGTPDRIDWVPGVSECAFDGEVRRLTMPGAGQIAERIITHDPEQMLLEYSCIESNPPLNRHHARIRIKPGESSGCVMIWETEVDPVEVEPFIKQSMSGCLARIRDLLD